MQTGLTAVGLGGFICFNAWLAGSGNRYWLSTIVIILVIGTIPWVALNLGVSTGLNFSAGFRTSFISGSEGDWQRLVVSNLTPLGLSTFPFLQIALATAIVITALYWSVGLRRHFGICYFKVLHKLKAIVTN
jgi:hypothetical protein